MSGRFIMAQNFRLVYHQWNFHMFQKSNALLRSREPLRLQRLGQAARTLSTYLSIQGCTQVRLISRSETNNRKYGTKSSTSLSNEQLQIENRTIVAKLLGIGEDEVTRVPSKLVNTEKAMHTIGVLRKFGFSASSVHLYPDILLLSGGAVENYIRIMHETGFPDVREVFIVRFRTVCKQSLAVLRKKLSLPEINDIVARYCAELEEDDAFMKNFIHNLPRDKEKMTLLELRNVMLGKYLGKLLLGSLDESLNAFAKYPRMNYRCFNWVKRNYRILKDFGFTHEKVKSHFYLLHTDPDNLSRVVTIKSLAGMDMTKLGHLRPKILMSSYETLLDIEKSLMEHEIPFESVQKYPEVFTLSAITIRQRLQEIDTIPEFQPMKTHPRVARLLYYHNKAKSRLEEFKSMQVRVPSLHLLSTDTKRYNRSLAAGDFRGRGVDIMIYLSEVFQTDRQRVRESLVRHPHWLHIPLLNIKDVLKFLQSTGHFSTEQLIDAIPLLLYPKEKVEHEYGRLIESREASLSDNFFLQMMLYFLERPQHFTGDAVWPDKVSQQEYEEDEVKEANESLLVK